MHVEAFTVGYLLTNCYVASCDETKEAVVVDPGFSRSEADRILGNIKKNSLSVKFVVDTHGHPDHICGNGLVKNATGASILIHRFDANLLGEEGKRMALTSGFQVMSPAADGFLLDGEIVRFGKEELQVIHTPGHSPGSISLVGDKSVFTGDTLFAGSIGRVDLPGGSAKDIVHSLRKKLINLSERLIVYPGHGPQSTIEKEKRSNPFLQPGFDPTFLG
ncbi:MAG: MBL fold metallo-hydrolase [Candidatus Bathyarchaeota archaeon]|nr:MBL fold metallo-hydrolase [Candidatus Bathyarchaeota archaeon]